MRISTPTFVQTHSLNHPTEIACCTHLIDGRNECPHNDFGNDQNPNGPSHKPPAVGHSRLWLDNGGPTLYGVHVYFGNMDADELPHNQWFELCEFVSRYGLEISIHGKF